MQLIFDSESETCIEKRMALIDKDTISEKFTENNTVDKLNKPICNGNKENIDTSDVQNVITNGEDHKKDLVEETTEGRDERNDVDAHTESSQILETSGNEVKDIVSRDLKDKLDNPGNNDKNEDSIDETINPLKDNIKTKSISDSDLKSCNLDKSEEVGGDKGEQTGSFFSKEQETESEKIDNDLSSDTEELLFEVDDLPDNLDDLNNKGDSANTMGNKSECDIKFGDVNESEVKDTMNGEKSESRGKDIRDNSSGNSKIHNAISLTTTQTHEKTEQNSIDLKENSGSMVKNIESKLDQTSDSQQATEDSINDINMETDIGEPVQSELSNNSICDVVNNAAAQDKIDEEHCNNKENKNGEVDISPLEGEKKSEDLGNSICETGSSGETEEKQEINTSDKASKKKVASKISLDILSEDEEAPTSAATENSNLKNEGNKQCIDIDDDDDDDIMLIDDEASSKAEEKVDNKTTTPQEELNSNTNTTPNSNIESIKGKTEGLDTLQTSIEESQNDVQPLEMDSMDDESKDNKDDIKKPESPKPLLPKNFVSSCKVNLSEMTRNELEEFCILKIVESVLDRGNLGEIKSQLKTMARNIEEYKNKTKVLTKQNQALQVVLKSVQEELKNNVNAPITPLKISRSVGIQVLMSEANNVSGSGGNSTVKKVYKVPRDTKPAAKSPKQVNTAQPSIPVPRLIPANSGAKICQPHLNLVASNIPPTTVKTYPKKAEKRPLPRRQSNSDTVDLTDDEPPPKVVSKPATNLRLVPSQNLMSPQRPPIGTLVNHPRKVYIPISGGQTQNGKPGQTYMLKNINSQHVKQRNSTSKDSFRWTTLTSHPAPLPECSKQSQPPNWKQIPPAPEIKLSKVENGIVISWKLDNFVEGNHESIASYQIYAYQETLSPPSTNLWKKIGDVKALPLPMACTLTQFMSGYKYYFAVRAVDVRSRLGPFSSPGNIMLVNK